MRAAQRLYGLGLLLYPRAFRRDYGAALAQTFRDRCHAALGQGIGTLPRLCGAEACDLALSAMKEHGDELRTGLTRHRRSSVMATTIGTQTGAPRLWLLRTVTLIAFIISLLASLNLYLLEDGNPLTQGAYLASPLLRFSYDGVYLSALAAGVAICAVLGYSLAEAEVPVLLGIACLVALGGFGGLLVRHPTTFLALLLAFGAMIGASLLIGALVAARARPRLGRQPAAVLGACAGTGAVLLVNLALLAPHTITLNPISHALYMQGQIAGTHLNALLIAMGVEALAVIACGLNITAALRRAT